MKIAELIKAERKKANLTMEELAKKLNLAGKATIYDYESGRVSPSLQVLEKMAKVLGCKLEINFKK